MPWNLGINSMKTGILVHVYHLETKNWEDLVWGNPAQDKMGTLPTLAWLVLTSPADQPVEAIAIGCGPSTKENLSEAEFTKKYLLDRLDQLQEFPRLRALLHGLSNEQHQQFEQTMHNIISMHVIKNTAEEVALAAKVFGERGIAKVLQVCVASHAPRCIQVQGTARYEGVIPKEQQWAVVASDTCFPGAIPADTLVLEPPHRGDDPMLEFRPTMGQALRPSLYASPEQKKALITIIHEFVERNLQQ